MRPMSSRPRSKSGVSTILGTLIFVGILFSVVIPLFLYVNQVNNLYDVTVIERRQLDQESEMERLEVYAFPVGESLNELNVYVKSKCALEVRVVRVWVNDVSYDHSLLLSGVSEGTIVDIGISPPGYFDVSVTTDRGNVFASLTNTIHITADGWEQGAYNFGIPIFVKTAGQYEITVTDKLGFTDVVVIKSAPTAYRIIQLPKPGTYYITVKGQPTWNFERTVNWEYRLAKEITLPPFL